MGGSHERIHCMQLHAPGASACTRVLPACLRAQCMVQRARGPRQWCVWALRAPWPCMRVARFERTQPPAPHLSYTQSRAMDATGCMDAARKTSALRSLVALWLHSTRQQAGGWRQSQDTQQQWHMYAVRMHACMDAWRSGRDGTHGGGTALINHRLPTHANAHSRAQVPERPCTRGHASRAARMRPRTACAAHAAFEAVIQHATLSYTHARMHVA